jgi:hypothetical protein
MPLCSCKRKQVHWELHGVQMSMHTYDCVFLSAGHGRCLC